MPLPLLLLLLAALAASPAVAATTTLGAWLVADGTGGAYTLVAGATTLVDARRAQSGAYGAGASLTFDVTGNAIQWYEPPVNTSLAALPAAFAARYANAADYATPATISATGVYRISSVRSQPFVVYFGTGATAAEHFECAATALVGPGAFTCTFIDNTTTLAPIVVAAVNTSQDGQWSLTVTIDAAASTALRNQIFSLVTARLYDLNSIVDTMQTEMLPSNQQRRSLAAQVTGGGVFLGIVGMIAHTGLTALLLSWTAPVFSAPLSRWTTRIKNSTSTDSWVWFVILLLLVLFTTLGGGLPAWAFMAVLYAVLEIALIIAYIVIRVRKPKNESATEEYEMQANAASGKSIDFSSGRALWTYQPFAMGRSQAFYMLVCAGVIVLIIILLVIIIATWGVAPYYVINRETVTPEVEVQPLSVSKSTLAIYSINGAATSVRMNFFLDLLTTYCGYSFNRTLSDNEKYSSIYIDFIYLFDIDMSQFDPEDYTQYYSVNDWFIRPLRAGSRPIDAPLNDAVITSAADSRVLVFDVVPQDFTFVVKEENFDVPTLVNNATLGGRYQAGSMAILRLAPQDYHRFHTPVRGTVKYISETIWGTIFSVNADAVNSQNSVYYNKRVVVVVSNPAVGDVTLVIIGATCVGSIVLDITEGQVLNKGDEIGLFQYGGSSMLVLFEPGKVAFDADLLYSSSFNIETFVKMGTQIARLAS